MCLPIITFLDFHKRNSRSDLLIGIHHYSPLFNLCPWGLTEFTKGWGTLRWWGGPVTEFSQGGGNCVQAGGWGWNKSSISICI